MNAIHSWRGLHLGGGARRPGSSSATAVEVSAGVAGVVQHGQDVAGGAAPRSRALRPGAGQVTGGKGEPRGVEGLHHCVRRSGGGEGGEQVRDRPRTRCRGPGRRGPRRRRPARSAAAMVRSPRRALDRIPPRIRARRKCSSASESWPFMPSSIRSLIVRVIEAVLVADQRARQRAHLQQPVPVGVVAGQPGTLQPQHDAGLAERHLGHQPLEAFPVGGRGARVALVDVDDHDLLAPPAERDGPAPQVVLAAGGFGVVDDLIEGRLADIQVGVAAQVIRAHLGGIGMRGG